MKRQLARWWADRPVRRLAIRLRPGLAVELYGGPLGAPWLSRSAGHRVLRPIPGRWAAAVTGRLLGSLAGTMNVFAAGVKAAAEQMGKAFQPLATEIAKLRKAGTL